MKQRFLGWRNILADYADSNVLLRFERSPLPDKRLPERLKQAVLHRSSKRTMAQSNWQAAKGISLPTGLLDSPDTVREPVFLNHKRPAFVICHAVRNTKKQVRVVTCVSTRDQSKLGRK